MKTIDPSIEYVTRDGRPVRIYSVGNGGGAVDVHGAVFSGGSWVQKCWRADGKFHPSGLAHPVDLVEKNKWKIVIPNLNCLVRVTVTPYGKKVIQKYREKQYEKYGVSYPEPTYKDNKLEESFWKILELFGGERLYVGSEIPFKDLEILDEGE